MRAGIEHSCFRNLPCRSWSGAGCNSRPLTGSFAPCRIRQGLDPHCRRPLCQHRAVLHLRSPGQHCCFLQLDVRFPGGFRSFACIVCCPRACRSSCPCFRCYRCFGNVVDSSCAWGFEASLSGMKQIRRREQPRCQPGWTPEADYVNGRPGATKRQATGRPGATNHQVNGRPGATNRKLRNS